MRSLALMTTIAVALTACSGSTGSIPGNTSVAPAAPGGSSSPAQPVPSSATNVTISIPDRATAATAGRRREFVSPSTSGVVVAIFTSPRASHPIALATLGVDLSKASALCSPAAAQGRTCTFALPAPTGTDDIAFTTYDAVPQSSGIIPANANALATATVTATIVAGKANSVSAALAGLVRSFGIPAQLAFPAGAASSQVLPFTAYDADHNAIVGNNEAAGPEAEPDAYANPVTLTAGSSFITLSKNGAAPAHSITIASASDTVAVDFSGSAPTGSSATVTASGAGLPPSGAGQTTLLIQPFLVTLTPQTITADGETATLTASEPGLARDKYSTVSLPTSGPGACRPDSLAFSSFYAKSEQPLTIAGYAAGHCTIAVTDGTSTVQTSIAISRSGQPDPGSSFLGIDPYGVTVGEYDLARGTMTSSFNLPPRQIAVGFVRDGAGDIYVTALTNYNELSPPYF